MKMTKKTVIVGILLIVGFFVFLRLRATNAQKKAVVFAKVKQGTLKETLSISGSIAADEHVALRFQTSGRLTYVGVKQGDYIKKGQLVATLDQRELFKKLQQDLNTFKKSRIDLDQGRADYDGKAITDAIKRTLDKTQLTLNNSIIDVELQDIALQYSRLSSPISGIVVNATAPYAGVNIIPSQAEYEVINPKTVYFSALADQTEVTKLYEGMEGDLILDSYPDKTLKGQVKTISFTPQQGDTGTVYAVKLALNTDNADFLYRIGMTGDSNFTTKSKKNAVYIPSRFIKEENDKKYVYIMNKGKKVKKTVETGIETDEDIEIMSGLAVGDVVYD